MLNRFKPFNATHKLAPFYGFKLEESKRLVITQVQNAYLELLRTQLDFM